MENQTSVENQPLFAEAEDEESQLLHTRTISSGEPAGEATSLNKTGRYRLAVLATSSVIVLVALAFLSTQRVDVDSDSSGPVEAAVDGSVQLDWIHASGTEGWCKCLHPMDYGAGKNGYYCTRGDASNLPKKWIFCTACAIQPCHSDELCFSGRPWKIPKWDHGCSTKPKPLKLPDTVASSKTCKEKCDSCKYGVGPKCCGCGDLRGCGGFCDSDAGFCDCSGGSVNGDGNYVPSEVNGRTQCKATDSYYSSKDPKCNLMRPCPGMSGFESFACPILKQEPPYPTATGDKLPCKKIQQMFKVIFGGDNRPIWRSELTTLMETISIPKCKVSKKHLKDTVKAAFQKGFSTCPGTDVKSPMPGRCAITYAYTVAANSFCTYMMEAGMESMSVDSKVVINQAVMACQKYVTTVIDGFAETCIPGFHSCENYDRRLQQEEGQGEEGADEEEGQVEQGGEEEGQAEFNAEEEENAAEEVNTDVEDEEGQVETADESFEEEAQAEAEDDDWLEDVFEDVEEGVEAIEESSPEAEVALDLLVLL